MLGIAWSAIVVHAARAHDIPNQRVDRSIQVTVRPGLLQIDYEVSLTELTLTQDLRALTGTLPGGDRPTWLARYAEVTCPLNAKGLLVSVDGRPVIMIGAKYDLVVEEHPRYTFHFEAAIPNQGRLSVRDRNYVSSEGTSRLAVRGRDGVSVAGDELPDSVDAIPFRPVWELSDDEERRTKQVEVRFQCAANRSGIHSAASVIHEQGARVPQAASSTAPVAPGGGRDGRASSSTLPEDRLLRLSALLDKTGGRSWILLAALAVLLGAAHAIQPGHGKTLVTAVALGPQARLYQPALLGVAATLAHMGSVLLIALVLWVTGATQVGTLHGGLTRLAGFVIAAAGLWRVGRYLGGYDEHESVEPRADGMNQFEILGLGLAGGLVPCWDAVGLVVLAAALGRLAEGVALVFAVSAGMAAVLIAVGWLAWQFKTIVLGPDRWPAWQPLLGLAGGVVISAVGLFLFLPS
jgi:ABC-type nickel/cobalt efflux system permease component RcnA